MSKKKSLGSSPIAFRSEKSTMGFIPDRGVSDKKKNTDTDSTVIATEPKRENKREDSNKDTSSAKEKKKIVSYYLETELIEKVKSIADDKDMYYSALVTSALKYWIAKKN